MSYCVAFTRDLYAIAVPYSRGGRSEDQLNAPRQGSALPLTACQTSYNVLLTQRYKKKAKLKQCFKNLMPSRKAQGVRFTLPLAPFLTALENSVCRKMQHSHTKALLF